MNWIGFIPVSPDGLFNCQCSTLLQFTKINNLSKELNLFLNWLFRTDIQADMPAIGAKYQVLLYGALHAPFISKLYGHMMFGLERIKKSL